MLIIRFARTGKVNRAQYKIVLQEKTIAPGGRHVEVLGSYDPHLKKAILKEERIKEWISKGAQLSDTVHNLFVSKNIISDKKRAVKLPAKKTEDKPAIETEEKGKLNVDEVKKEDEKKEEGTEK